MWVIPHMLGVRTAAVLTGAWDGNVRIGRIHFDYDGSATIDQMALEDLQGKSWATIRGTRLDFSRVSRFAIGLTQIDVEKMDVDFYRARPLPLIRRPHSLPSGKRRYTRTIIIKDIVVTAHSKDVAATYPEPLHLKLQQEPVGYEFSLERGTPESPDDQWSVTGSLDPESSMTRVALHMAGPLDSNEISVILAWAGLSPDYSGRARLDARVDLQGSWRNPETLQANGYATFTEGAVLYQGVELASKLSVPCEVNDTDCRGKIEGQVLGGPLSGRFTLRHEGLRASRLNMSFQGTGLQLGAISDRFPRWKALSQGNASCRYAFTANAFRLQDVNGIGVVHVENTDVRVMPIISQILEAVDLAAHEASRTSDVVVAFHHAGTSVTIEDGRIANAVSALKTEPNGHINLDTRQVNLYMVFIPLKQVEGLLSKIPVLNWFVHIKDKLVRLHVEGSWDEPASKLVAKEPVKDVSEAALGFIKDVIGTGGKIPRQVFDALASLIDSHR